MRIKSIQLSWFRGAADPVALEPDCSSMVVYGSNGSGKSTFIDAIEYVLNDGRIEHLAHEYSGKRQEKAIPNTHKPEDRETEFSIKFKDGSDFKVTIAKDGTYKSSGADAVAMSTWEYRRTVLRQHEVSEFIHSTKTQKYSVLLPLLGLSGMELAAENLRQLSKSIEEELKIGEAKAILMRVENDRKETFGKDTDDQIFTKIKELHTKYCPEKATAEEAISWRTDVKSAIDSRLKESTQDQRRYVAINEAASLQLENYIYAVRTTSAKLAGAVEPLIIEKLEVLRSTSAFVEKLQDEEEVQCPACGSFVSSKLFRAHIESERERLSEIIGNFNDRKVAIGALCDKIKLLQSTLSKADLKSWRDGLDEGSLAQNLEYLDRFDTEALRTSCQEYVLSDLVNNLKPLIDAAVSSSKDAPPDAQQLSTDKRMIDIASTIIEANAQSLAIKRAEALIAFIKSLEQGARAEIRARSRDVISEISADIKTMWSILHPGEAIEDLSIYLPDDADKAIDIRLKFYGIEQDSPRLTLSEGYRNSLGLCIFLAMAMREAKNDRPLFLDDVVLSLDRNHRGMIAEILEKEFCARQVVILTHDRDWYTDLRSQLNNKTWGFKILMPYETPDIGIRWSHKTTTFDDARAFLKDRPDSAGNDARKIMDVELAVIAEKLKIKLPFLRGDKNDKRMALDFIERLASDGKSCFQKRMGKDYGTYTEGLEAIKKAGSLLVSWGNRASHSPDLVRSEATKLIDTCEKALECLKCSSCGNYVWYANAANPELVQCLCGELRWRYGKG
jgi:recombinational DNA repair ATPase RecF